MESGSSPDIDSFDTRNDNGVLSNPVTPKRPKLEQKSTKDVIVDNLSEEIASFHLVGVTFIIKDNKIEDDYRGLYRLYRAALKALKTLERECKDIEEELEPLPLSLPIHTERVQSSNDNVKMWSEYFDKTATPTKMKRLNTIPSPATVQIRALLHAVASFSGITAAAVCSSKRTPENMKNLQHLLKISKTSVERLKSSRDQIEKELEPYMKDRRVGQSSNPGASES